MPPLALLLATLPVVAYDYDFEENGIYYLITSDDDLTCAVAPGNKAYAGNVVIPATATFEGTTYKVTAIAAKAFKDCKRLKSIDLGNVTKIGSNAFEYCTSLTTIDLKNVTELGKCAFKYCTSLTTIDLKNLTELGECAFIYCESLESIDLGKVSTLSGTFYKCTSLKEIKGTQRLTELSYGYSGSWTDGIKGDCGAFEYCSSLTSIDLPNVELAGYHSLRGTSLTTLILPNCTSIHEGAFWSETLTKLAIPKAEGYYIENSFSTTLAELILGENAHFSSGVIDYIFTGMRKLTCLSAKPNPYKDYFPSKCFPNADLYVPKGSAAAYKAEYPSSFQNVYEFDPEVKMNESAVTIRLDGRYQLSAMALPYYDSTNIQWESSNPSIADVSSKGLVFGFSEGNATITAKYGDATATCAVKVSKTESVEDVKVDAATEYDVYNLQGIMVRSKCDKADIYDLPGGIYILVSPQGRTKVRI